MHTTKLGLLGLGSMGLGVAQRLLDSGFDVTVYNRTKDKATPAVQAGARLADSVPDAVAETGIVLLSLADETAVEQVLFGAALSALRPGAIVVDCSTVSPQFSRSATARLAAAGHARVEACLVGNPLQARSGQLRVLTAGESSDVEAVRPVLEAAGQELIYLGPAGMAATLKLVLNLLLGAQVASFVEAVSYGEKAGLDRETLLTTITSTNGFTSEVMRFRARFIQQQCYEPAAFRTALMAKDLRLALDDAAGLGMRMPVIETTARRYDEAVTLGHGDCDTAVIMELQ